MNAAVALETIDSQAVPRHVPEELETKRGSEFPATRLILVATLCGAPLAFGAVESWAWPLLTLLALAAFASWGITWLRRGRVRVYWTPLYVLGALFLAVGLVQFLTGMTQDRFATRNALVLMAGEFVLFFTIGQVFAEESSGAWHKFGQVVALYALGLGLFSIFQFFTSHGSIYWSIKPPRGFVFGPYVNRNDYAGLMEMLIPIAVAYAFTRHAPGFRRPLYMFAVAIGLASVLLCGSRGGMVALLFEAVVFAIISVRVRHFARWRRSAMVGLLVLVAGVSLSVWLNPSYLPARVASVADFPAAPEVTLGQRLIVSRDTLAIFRHYPLLGTGLGSFMVVFPQYQTIAGNPIWVHAHDDYAEALAETGLIGGLLLFTALYFFFRSAFGRLKERLESSAGWIQLACALGCCGLLAHSFVDFNLHIPANSAWFVACLGLATCPPISRHRAVRRKDNTEKE